MAEQKRLHSLLSAAAGGGRLHHALLLTGGADREEALRFAAAAYECTAEGTRPCLRCEACRKVLAGIHPDVITAEDREHKNLSADVLRALRADAFIRPNEGARKVYLFPDAARLTAQDQNLILKLVEEWPPYAAFVFAAESASDLLLTLRSRCVELPLEGERAEEVDPMALHFAELLAGQNWEEVIAFLIGFSGKKPDRETLLRFLLSLRTLLMRALLGRYRRAALPSPAKELAALPPKKTARLISLLRGYAEDGEANVGTGLILGALAVDMEDIL